jgi:hypothetical protein
MLVETFKNVQIADKNVSFVCLFVYDSAEQQMLNTISLVIEQRKNKFDRIASLFFSQSIFIPCEGDITFRTPVRVYF